MSKRVSVRAAARSAKREDTKGRKAWADSSKMKDSFQNFTALMGIGTANVSSGATYGFNPITRVRTLLEWIHRGSWLGGVAVDIVANDMTRAGVTIQGKMKPEDMAKIETMLARLEVWDKVNEVIKWSRLYGGALGVYLIEGQKFSTPLRLETVSKNQFKGIFVLDRWMVNPSLGDLITDFGPNMGLPKYYTVTTQAAGLQGERIHYSRVFRLDGIKLPIWQRQTENLWGISVLERLYDRMVAFDSATTGAAQLVYKSYLRTYKIENMREIIAAGGDSLAGLLAYVDMMRQFQSIEGITLLDKEDEFEAHTHAAFSGLVDILNQLAGQIGGALEMPLTRLMAQSSPGLNSSGTGEERQYYDGINQKQKVDIGTPIDYIYRMMAQSLGIKVPDDFGITFNPLWQLSDMEKADIAQKDTESIRSMEEAGITSRLTNLKELKQRSHVTERWTNISQKEFADAEELPPPVPEKVAVVEAKDGSEVEVPASEPKGGEEPDGKGKESPDKGKKAKKGKAEDAAGPTFYPAGEWF